MAQPPHTGAVDTIRVLHIDDEREPLRMTKKLLEMADAGLKVESVSSPVEALEMLRGGGFDCVVTDYKMSPMDGIEVARNIRESSDLPIIIYTGHGSEDVAVKAFAVGIDDYVRKELHPLHFEVLANRIRGVVERRWVEKLYGDILDGSRDGVIIVEGTKFIYANQAMADLLGASDPLELIGRDILDWIPKSDRERVKRYSLKRQKGEDAPSAYEYSISTSGGEQRVLETSVTLNAERLMMNSGAPSRDGGPSWSSPPTGSSHSTSWERSHPSTPPSPSTRDSAKRRSLESISRKLAPSPPRIWVDTSNSSPRP